MGFVAETESDRDIERDREREMRVRVASVQQTVESPKRARLVAVRGPWPCTP